MKRFVLLLLGANIVFFGVIATRPEVVKPPTSGLPAAPLPQAVPGLVLISEHDGTLEFRESSVVAVPEPPAAPTELKPVVAQAAPADSVADTDTVPTENPAASANPQVTAQAVLEACFRVGPIPKKANAQALAAAVGRKKGDGKIIGETVTEARYWVHLSGAQSLKEAGDLVSQLEARGFTDHLIMREPEFLHAISLGVFRDRVRGERLLKQLQDAFFPARLSTREVKREVFWVACLNISPTDIRAAIASVGGLPASQLQVLSCGENGSKSHN